MTHEDPSRSCHSYRPGHNPHWIQVLHSGRDKDHPAVPARVHTVEPDGTVVVDLDGAPRRFWTHDRERLTRLLPRNTGSVLVQPRWSLLRIPIVAGASCFSICDVDRHDPSPCLDHAPTGDIIERLTVAGGFTMRPSDLPGAATE